LAAGQVASGAKSGCACVWVGEGVGAHPQQFRVIELVAFLGCYAECGVEPATGFVRPPGGDEQAVVGFSDNVLGCMRGAADGYPGVGMEARFSIDGRGRRPITIAPAIFFNRPLQSARCRRYEMVRTPVATATASHGERHDTPLP